MDYKGTTGCWLEVVAVSLCFHYIALGVPMVFRVEWKCDECEELWVVQSELLNGFALIRCTASDGQLIHKQGAPFLTLTCPTCNLIAYGRHLDNASRG